MNDSKFEPRYDSIDMAAELMEAAEAAAIERKESRAFEALECWLADQAIASVSGSDFGAAFIPETPAAPVGFFVFALPLAA